jgi:hypothetical protein
VFFKKENLRNKGPYWLSMFYGFCIQSLVRTALLEITKRLGATVTKQAEVAASQYLYLPLRLFVASSSGSKDPILSDEAAESGLSGSEAYQQAREAVNYTNWNSAGIQNSGDYLKQLFQDDGGLLRFNPAKAQADPLTDNEGVGSEKRQKLNLWKCRQCREARKKVSHASICHVKIWAEIICVKCFPSDRVWPQKCDRCLAHRPEALCCSEPEMNTRKRGSNIRERLRQPSPVPPPSPNNLLRRTASIESSLSHEITSWSEESDDRPAQWERPKRTKTIEERER